MDYTIWRPRELVEELERRDRQYPELLEKCAECGEPLYTTVRAHHHTEGGQDVTVKTK